MTSRSFLKGVSAIASGTAIAQIIQLSASPIITRLYEPAHLGGAGAVLAIVGMLLPWATLGFSSSIVVVKSPVEAQRAYAVSQRVTLLFCIALMVVTVSAALVSAFTGAGVAKITWAALFIAPITYISATRETRNFFLSRLKKFGIISRLSAGQAAVYSGLRIVGGLVFPSILSLLLAYIAAMLVQTGLSLRAMKREAGPRAFRANRWTRRSRQHSLAFARKHKDYALFRAPQSFLSAFSQGLPIVFVGAFAGLHEAGIVTLAKTIVAAPVVLVGQAVSIVALSHFSSRINEGGNIHADQLRTTLLLAGAGILPVLVLMAYGPGLFALVFGEAWRESGAVAAALSPLMFFQIISRPAISAIQPLGLIRWHFAFEVVAACVKSAALYIGFLHSGYMGAILAFSIVTSLCYLYVMRVALKASRLRAGGVAARKQE